MAMAQAIQERLTDDLWLTASTPMSGPYDVSGGMRNLILSDQEYLFVGYAVYVLVGYQEVYGDIYQDLSDVIKPAYLEDVTKFSRHEINLSLLNSNLTDLLIDNVGRILPREIFTDQFIAELTDTTSLITHRLKENDTYRWVPETPMRLYYCESDEQVLFQNSITAVTYMTENGAEDVKAFNLSSTVDHAFCAIFAVTSSIAFLDSFDVISSAEYEVARDFDIFMPNPVRDLAHLNSEIAAASQLTVFNLQGQTVAYFSSVPQFLDLRDLPQGIYMVRINSEKGIFTQRLVKQ